MRYLIVFLGLSCLLLPPISGQTTYLSDDFEDGDLTGWTEGQSGDWIASSSYPITGTYSLKHNLSSVSGNSHLCYSLTGLKLSSGTTSWRFDLKNGSWDPSANNKFWVYLIANETNLSGSTVDGYAVGVNLTGSNDILTLWKVTDGSVDGAIVTSSLDWNSGNLIGIEVSRTSSGTWELKYDADGGFDNLVSAGTGSNSDYTTTSYFGLYFEFTSTRAGKLRMDDVTITQSSGNTTTVQFASSSASVSESGDTYNVAVSISNEDVSSSTSVEVALTGGTAINGADISSYSNQTVTFPAGSSDNQTVAVTITDDSSFETDETLVFTLQNVTGGNSASVGSPSQFTLTIQDNDAPNFVINEIHADPDPTNGDANGDGTVSTSQDEFVEIVNNHGSDMDISGWTLSDNISIRHTFSENTTLPNGGAIVVFGGGTPTGTFGGSVMTTASSGALGLNNSGDSLTLKGSNGATVAAYAYGSEGGDDQSITRSPDITGSFVKHSTVADANGALFSPGTKLNGKPFIGITVEESLGSTAVSEDGAIDTYTIVLESQPSANVMVTITPDAQTTVDPALLTFSSSDYASARTITVSAVDDANIEGGHTSTISHSASSGDPNYDGIEVASVTVAVTDNDAAGVTIVESEGSTAVTEGGETDSYTVVLNSAPSSDVTISVSASNSEISVDSNTLTFGSSNYYSPQVVSVTAVDDATIEGSHASVINHSASSGDPDYDEIEVASVTVAVTDNDTAGVTIVESEGSTEVTEGGRNDTYTLILTSAPSSDVTISILSSTTDVTVNPTVVTFTNSNYDTAQTVTVTAVDDAITEGSHTSILSHSANSSDPNYNGITITNVTVTVMDNDVAEVTIVESEGSTEVTEGGETDSYTMVLNSAPGSDVTISVSASGGEVSVSPNSLTFTGSNYTIPQAVTVTAVDDEEYEGDHAATITHTASSADSHYDGITINDVSVGITDDDMPNVVINEIHYNPNDNEGYQDNEYEFIELYNGEGISMDIGGFSFTDGISHTFTSGTSIPAGGYLVVARNSSQYAGSVAWTSGSLLNSGEKIALSTAPSGGTVVDVVTYGDNAPWPTASNGSGPSLELINSVLDNSVGASWKASASNNGTPGAQNSVYESNPKPLIYDIVQSPNVPSTSENMTVSATVSDNGSLSVVRLVYSRNGGSEQQIDMIAADMTYSGIIPTSGFSDGDRLYYYVAASDDAFQISTSDTARLFVGTTSINSLRQRNDMGESLYADYYARIRGVATVSSGIFSVSNLSVYLQDATGGIHVFKPGASSASVTLGNDYTVVGRLTHYHGNLEIIPDNGSADIRDNGPGTIPSPQVKTIRQLLNEPETFEGRLITIENVTKGSPSSDWPPSGSDASLIITDDGGSNVLTLFVDKRSNVDERTEPIYPMDVTGIFYQEDEASPYNEGYRLAPRASTDILGNQPATSVTFASTLIAVDEGGGSFDAIINIANPSSVLSTSVTVELKNGDSTVLGDATGQTVTFSAGDSAGESVSYTVMDDTSYTGNKTLQFALRDVSGEYGASIGTDSIVTVSIVEDELPPNTVVQFASLSGEINEDEGTVTINVAIGAPGSDNDTGVDVALTGGTGTANDIDNYTTQHLTFPAGSSDNQSILLNVTDDVNYEGDETLVFALRNISGGNSATLGNDSTFMLMVKDNDLQTIVQFSSSDTTVIEGIDTTVNLAVKISNSFTIESRVEVVLKSGSAEDVDNYTTQALLFPANSSSDQQLTIRITDNDVVEPDEALVFALENASGGNVATVGSNNQFVLTIRDSDVYSLVLNEIHYNPSSHQGSDDDYEFLELYNSGDQIACLDGYSFREGIRHSFTSSDSIVAGGYLLLAKNGATYAGSLQWTSGGLRNDGEAIVIVNGPGFVVDSVTYDEVDPWPTSPNGKGPSLELIDPSLDNSLVSSWRASFVDDGTPGGNNSSNSRPQVFADEYSVNEDSTLVVAAPGILGNDTDDDNDDLTATPSNGPSHGTLHLGSDGSFDYEPDRDYFGSDSFTYVANDGKENSSEMGVAVTVNPVNDAPIIAATADPDTIPEDAGEQTIELSGIGTGASNEIQSLTITATSSNTGLIADPTVTYTTPDSTGILRYAPIENTYGSATIQVMVKDDGGTDNGGVDSTVTTFKIAVSAVNDPPAVAIGDVVIAEDSSVVIALPRVDVDGDSLTYLSATADTSAIEATYRAGNEGIELLLIPMDNWNGTANVTISVADNTTEVTETFALTVTPVNDPPLEFDLVWPMDSLVATITPKNLTMPLIFSWQSSVDLEGDSITYNLIPSDSLAFLAVDEIDTTTISFVYKDIADLMDSLGIVTGTWTVEASDGDTSTAASNGPFMLTIDQTKLKAETVSILPQVFALYPNYPNPFNPTTTLRYDLPQQANVTLTIYDILGRKVRNMVYGIEEPGFKSVIWDGTNDVGETVSAGIYLYHIRAGDYIKTRKMILLK